jgi:uncharacterized integral membrane protein (TIGR00698 family)
VEEYFDLKEGVEMQAEGSLKKSLSLSAWALLAVLSLLPAISAPLALFAGAGFGLLVGNPSPALSRMLAKNLLMASVVGLGAGMDLRVIGKVGMEGVGYTAVGIIFTLGLGTILGRVLGCNPAVSLLISVGTAICGGSAIAAAAPVTNARAHDITVALATVFLLNGIALFLFPAVGHFFALSPRSFGLWSALAIHDTSSVVGASMLYGKESLEVGTSVKLARALWIAPLTLILSLRRKSEETENGAARVSVPWFIFAFLALAGLMTVFPQIRPVGAQMEGLARRGMVLTLFLIGSNLNRKSLREVGVRPLLQGLLLWIVVASLSLLAVVKGWAAV